ncbi:MAG: L,D-transpeptidase family protein [Spirochaetales bacterium]|nr:L,D-transpeptidase family protein [Spirochaetales bacterium]
MKLNKSLILLIITFFIFISCSGENEASDTKDVSKKEADSTEVQTESLQEESLQEEALQKETSQVEAELPKTYVGQIFDCLDEDGIVNVYSEKDSDSEVIQVYDSNPQVELLETLPFGWFKIRMDDGREGYVDARNIKTDEIPPHEYGIDRDGYVLVFTHKDQHLSIYHDGKFILSSIASSGLPDLFTPRGIFQIEPNRRGPWFFVKQYGVGIKYWVGFKGVWLFHSIPFDENENIIKEEEAKLGEPASHGCIRLPVEVAEYIYNNVPEGSLVLIY